VKQKQITKQNSKLIALILGIFLPLLVFGELALEIQKNGGILGWDASILLAIHQTAKEQIDVFAANLTNLGTSEGVIPATVAIALTLLFLRRWRQSAYLILSIAGCYILSPTVKVLFHRVRPSLWELTSALPSDYSFPSGHAMSSMTFVMALMVLSWGTRWFPGIAIAGSLFAVAIGWTRLYLGVHYPSDILAGWMLAIALAMTVSLLVKPHVSKVPISVPQEE
jgi:membrane-associated phospholipid phosphatase